MILFTVARELSSFYIVLDITFLSILAFLLYKEEKYLTLWFGVFGALLYFVVDYGVFYLLLHTRSVTGANTFLFLLWLSTSYGFTNFVWIWLWLNKDKRLLEWSLLIVIGWLSVALISQAFGDNYPLITISRETTGYHGYMAIILFIGYLYLIVHNITSSDQERYPILYILAIGLLVQFTWETILLITGIRPDGFSPLLINSLLETNLGLPYLFMIHRFITKRFSENLAPITLNTKDAISKI